MSGSLTWNRALRSISWQMPLKLIDFSLTLFSLEGFCKVIVSAASVWVALTKIQSAKYHSLILLWGGESIPIAGLVAVVIFIFPLTIGSAAPAILCASRLVLEATFKTCNGGVDSALSGESWDSSSSGSQVYRLTVSWSTLSLSIRLAICLAFSRLPWCISCWPAVCVIALSCGITSASSSITFFYIQTFCYLSWISGMWNKLKLQLHLQNWTTLLTPYIGSVLMKWSITTRQKKIYLLLTTQPTNHSGLLRNKFQITYFMQ